MASRRDPGRRRSALRSVASRARTTPALIGVTGAWSVGALTRFLSEHLPLERDALTSDQLLQRRPGSSLRGARPMLDGRVRVDDRNELTAMSVVVTTDRQGWRDAEAAFGSSRVVALGDGFAFGLGMPEKHLFTRQTGVATKSIGAPGRSMVDTVLQIEEMTDDLAGRILVWLIYLGNDLTDNLRPFVGATPVPYARFSDSSWAVQTAHVTRDAAPVEIRRRNYLADLAAICSDTPESARALSAADHLLAEADGSCRRSGARLVVMTVPRRAQLHRRDRLVLRTLSPDPASFDVYRPDAHLQATCDRLGVVYIPLLDHLDASDYQPGDRLHWRRSGHRKVGALIGQVHSELTAGSAG